MCCVQGSGNLLVPFGDFLAKVSSASALVHGFVWHTCKISGSAEDHFIRAVPGVIGLVMQDAQSAWQSLNLI